MPVDFFFLFSHLKFRISINLPSFNSAEKRTIDEGRDESRIRLNRSRGIASIPTPSPLSVLSALDAETQPPRGFSSADLSYLEILSCRPINIYQLSAPSVSGRPQPLYRIANYWGANKDIFQFHRSVIRFDQVWWMARDLSSTKVWLKSRWSSSSPPIEPLNRSPRYSLVKLIQSSKEHRIISRRKNNSSLSSLG